MVSFSFILSSSSSFLRLRSCIVLVFSFPPYFSFSFFHASLAVLYPIENCFCNS
uniref:Uncharacterized protein n=1 Tax=Rhizophora mucronata TaxID=61149 RepID=A0A2P2PNC9_RHIMU